MLRNFLYVWDNEILNKLTDPYEAFNDSFIVAILTYNDEFIFFYRQRFYNNMKKTAFVLDGRNIEDLEKLKNRF